MEQISEPGDSLAASRLYRNIKDFRIIKDPACGHLTVDQFFDHPHKFFLVSKSFRREVYAIHTPFGNFFFKFSPVLRKKDRLRFLLLPWRITTEWRNLSRLRKKGVPAPQRVLFGYKGIFPNRGFFLVTEDARGSAIDCRNPDPLLKLAGTMAALHAKGIFHRDIHPENVLMDSDGNPVLLDAQEIYFLPWLPHRLKIANLGQLWWHLRTRSQCPVTLEDFLKAYRSGGGGSVSAQEVADIADRRQQRYYRSRSRRCCKNSTEFQTVKNGEGWRGFKRRDFLWGKAELQTALAQGTDIKDKKLIAYEDVCIKIHNKRLFHKDRALASWKMAGALAARGINVPRALACFMLPEATFFLADFYSSSMTLNDYFSTEIRTEDKKAAIKKFADWLRTCHDLNIWQRDFKSSNVLVLDNEFMMVDLEGVKICRRLSWRRKLINMAQLNASVSNRLTARDRLRFFHFYCREALLSRKTRRQAYQKIWKITQKKNTLPFGLDLEKLNQISLKRPNRKNR